MKSTYPLTADGIYRSVQGEGALIGIPMIFIRLAGCSVGCHLCDADYRVRSRMTPDQIVSMAVVLGSDSVVRWAWITGGEPADHDLRPLVDAIKDAGFSVALATSGHRPLPAAASVAGGLGIRLPAPPERLGCF